MADYRYYDEDPTIYSLTDEAGQKWEFELLDEMDYADNHYYAMLPVTDSKEKELSENQSIMVLRAVINPDTGEEEMETPEEDEYERVGSIFLERLGIMEVSLYEEEDWEEI